MKFRVFLIALICSPTGGDASEFTYSEAEYLTVKDGAHSDNSTYDLALYFVDWDRNGMHLSAEIMDLKTKELIGPTKHVGDSTNGAYLVCRVTGSCRVSVNLILEDILASFPASHHVIDRPCGFITRSPSHTPSL